MTKGYLRERHAPLTDEELDAVTVVFHQFETGLREGTIYTKVIVYKCKVVVHIVWGRGL
jgi:hypothetical protein